MLMAMQDRFQNFSAEDDATLALLRLEPVANLRFGTRCFDPFEPIATGNLLFGRDDFHGVAAAQNVLQRHQLAVDARPGTVDARPRSGCDRRSR